MTPTIEFRKEDHTYWIGDEQIPNVTSIIDVVMNKYNRIDPDVMERARQEGDGIHSMVELWCKKNLDEDNLPEWLKPHHRAWLNFVEQSGLKVITSEERIYHERFKYTGTLDLICEMPKLGGNLPVIIDVKRSFFGGAFIGLQLAAYANAWESQIKNVIASRYALQLSRDGSYRLKQFSELDDFSTFLSLLSTYRWLKKHNLLMRKT